MASVVEQKTAIWAITPNGKELALKIGDELPGSEIFFSSALEADFAGRDAGAPVSFFEKLKRELEQRFHAFSGHIFIMATGIVVRMIVPLIRHKTEDPAVVVMDDAGGYAISLLSGHIGGANSLALEVARITGAEPVITTATDVNRRPAIDLMAKEKGLAIENPEAIKTVNMAILTGKKIFFHDPYHLLGVEHSQIQLETDPHAEGPKVIIDDRVCEASSETLVLRPGTLIAGIGCNRGTEKDEIRGLLFKSLAENNLCPASLSGIATIDIKHDEAGIVELAEELDVPLAFFERGQLDRVENITSPSAMVEKHVGVKSVCEAAAILAANRGELLVPKQKTKNVTVAIARTDFTS